MKANSIWFALLGLALVGQFHAMRAARAEVIGIFGPVTIEASRMPTADLPGHSTWTLSAASPLEIRGFDFFGHPDSAPGAPDANGFFGPMNQVNPFGQPTVFDSGDFCPVCLIPDNDWLMQDSHFLVGSTPILVPARFTAESSNHLRAVYARIGEPFGNQWDIVQLVVPDATPDPVEFRGIIVVGPIDNLEEIAIAGLIPPIPEPASVVFFGIAPLVTCLLRRTRTMRID